jgi:hypothetical protein
VFNFTNPCIPNVEGKRYEKDFQYHGIADDGHEMPDTKSSIIEVKTKSTNGDSRSFTKAVTVIAKKQQASR